MYVLWSCWIKASCIGGLADRVFVFAAPVLACTVLFYIKKCSSWPGSLSCSLF